MTILLSEESINNIKRHVLLVNRAVTDERWPDVLILTKYCANETPLILSQSNLALFQTGKLLDSMFAYPQSKGTLATSHESNMVLSHGRRKQAM